MSTTEKVPAALTALYDRYCLGAFDKQITLNQHHGQHKWTFNLQKGLLIFEDRFEYTIQILGTQSEIPKTWRWAWADDDSGIRPALLEASLKVKHFGEEHGLPFFTEPEIALGCFNGHYLALVCSGLCQAKAYYCGPYEGGAGFVLITDDRLPANTVDPLVRLRGLFFQAVGSLPLTNHKRAFNSYLEYLGLSGQAEGPMIVVTHEGRKIETTFDHLDRLTNMAVNFK
jgi:hypothetical protein